MDGITGKGMEKNLGRCCSYLNLLSLDMDAGTSEITTLNRFHLMVSEAREQEVIGEEAAFRPKMVRRFRMPGI